MYRTILVINILFLTFNSLVAQENPQDLGKKVFTCFKNIDYEGLSKLTPKADEALKYYKDIDSTVFKNEKEFRRKYITHDSIFVEKCIAMMLGKAGVDFKKADLVEIKYFEKPYGQIYNGRKLTRNYLEIYFISDNKKYSLLFRDVRKFENIWKLGESVRLKEEE